MQEQSVGHFRPMLPNYALAKQAKHAQTAEVITTHTHDYGDKFLEKLKESYPGIPMHGRFKKYGTDYSSDLRIGREIYALVYSITEGHPKFFRNLLYRVSPFAKELISLRKIGILPPEILVHDLELQGRENLANIENIVQDLNNYMPVRFNLNRESIEEHAK